MTPTTLKWVIIVLGLWIVLSPFILNVTGTGRWNNIISGILVVAAGYMLTSRQATA